LGGDPGVAFVARLTLGLGQGIGSLEKLLAELLEVSSSLANAAIGLGQVLDRDPIGLGHHARLGPALVHERHTPHVMAIGLGLGALAAGLAALDLVLVERGGEEGLALEHNFERLSELPIESVDALSEAAG